MDTKLKAPWMHPSEIKMIEKYLKDAKDKKMLEWGSGGSTLHFSKFVKEYISIEHNKNWFDKIKEEIGENTKYFHVPANDLVSIKISSFADYKDYIQKAGEFGQKFDFVLIDGRARFECAKFILNYLHKKSIVFIHDFYKRGRDRYHEALKYYDVIDEIKNTKQTLVVLKPKHQFKRPTSEILEYIKRAKKHGEGLSIGRFGDGEFLAATSISIKDDRHNIPFKKHLGYIPSLEYKQAISDNIIESCKKIDILCLNKYQSKKWCKARNFFLKTSNKLSYYTADFHTEWMANETLFEIIEMFDKVLLINGHDLKKPFLAKFPHIKEIEQFFIPKQPCRFKSKEPHYPGPFNETMKKIKKKDLSGFLCLIGGGFVGKKYIIECKNSGGIAIDIGSVFDRWAGFITRGKGKGFEKVNNEYRLGK